MKKKNCPLVVILGPTASGKTKLAIDLARKFRGEIICADSRTVYKKLDIGTAKPTKEEQKKVSHYLLDIVEPGQQYSVAEFKKLAEQKIEEIWSRGKIPFLVGGTGLYIDAVIYGYDIPPVAPDQKLRQKLEKLSRKDLLGKLKEKDPEFATQVDKNNKRRLIRALEVIQKTGQKFSKLRSKKRPKYDLLILGINIPRQKLLKKIDVRIDARIKAGMIQEVEDLVKKYKIDPVWLENLGLEYRWLTQYVLGRLPKDEAIQKLKFETHAFSRRQMTWFKRNKEIHWIKSRKEAQVIVQNFLIQLYKDLILELTPAKEISEPALNFITKAKKSQYQFGRHYSYSDESGKKIDWGIHAGVDATLKPRTSIRTIADGLVVYSKFHPGISKDHRNWGNIIIIGHNVSGKVIYSLYGHLKRRLVEFGDKVKADQKIGEIAPRLTPENGWWGISHLHFAIYKGPFRGLGLPGYARKEIPYSSLKYWQNPIEFFKKVV